MRGHWGRPGIAAWALIAVVLAVAVPALADNYVTISQGWSTKQRAIWYTRSQGSRLIPLSWLRALEQPGSDQPFLDDSYIRGFRYLPDHLADNEGLPVGFAIDQQDGSRFSNTRLRWKSSQSSREKWVGMNCAACHTADISFQGKNMRIEGGPTMADFQGFMEAIDRAMVETKTVPEKARRFEARVLGDTDNTPENKAKLQQALSRLIDWQQRVRNANATSIRYGFGRLDAFGHIFNKVALVVEADDQRFSPSNAPVSYPFMWNVPQHDKVQWNGIVSNNRIGSYDVGALARNIGEVTGVFADVKISPPTLTAPFVASSANVVNLNILENQLTSLRPPLWPTGVLGKIDDQKRDRGREIFIQTERSNGRKVVSCSTCHKGLPRNNLDLPIRAVMTPLRGIGTDIWMACNSVTREARTGIFKNMLYTYLPTLFLPDSNRLYSDKAAIADLLRTTVIGTIWADRRDVIRDISRSQNVPASAGLGSTAEAPSALPPDERPSRSAADQDRRNRCLNGSDPLLAYKGRPLTGIWATAPYLHNGAVPTLYDLLLPPDQRPRKFLAGTREFDPKRVGFVTRDASGQLLNTPTADNSFLFETRDNTGRVIDGNSNAGHDYGNAWLTEDERWALVEYMKGL